jgi:NAD+ kinase
MNAHARPHPLFPGRTKVRSNIQHVLIVTKARDNRLIKLTRELAIYLMTKKRPNNADGKSGSNSAVNKATASRGMVV